MTRFQEDLTGLTFNKWKVLSFAGEGKWTCKCICGNVRNVKGWTLKAEKSTGCVDCKNPKPKTHGMSRIPERQVWQDMLYRCEDTEHPCYKSYGGRGIKVCAAWHDMLNFWKDMGKRPEGRLSIDRIDNNGNYSCGHCKECQSNGWAANCKWETQQGQARNTRRNRWITVNGVSKIITDWAADLGIDVSTLHSRLDRGWSEEAAVTVPKHWENDTRGK